MTEPRPCTVLGGLSAIASVEAMMSDSAALAAGHAASAAALTWDRRRRRAERERTGRALASVDASGPRGAVAAAVGLALSGERATAFLSGPDALAAQDVLAQASGLRLPLVLHLACRASAGHAPALGSGHEAYHATSERGWFQLFASNVQEAVDLALVARRAAERALVPGLVAMDAEQTALSVQDVRLPEAKLVASYVGEPSDRIEAPTDAQRLIFGAVRRRVPRLHDLDRPMLLAPLEGPEVWGLGVAAARPAFVDPLESILDAAAVELAEATGRSCGALASHHLDGARIVIVAQGAAVETAAAVAAWVRRHERARVGVLGLRRLRPFPGAAIVAALRGADVVAVLERVDTPLGGDGPLARDIRAAIERARENARARSDVHAGYPALRERDVPRIVGVPYGLGGLPLRAADLRALIAALAEPSRPLVYLGVDFIRPAPAYPKRQALMDALKRSRPELASLGLRSTEPAPDVRGDGAITVALHRVAGAHDGLAAEAAVLLQATRGGALRARPAVTGPRAGAPCRDLVTLAPAPGLDPGDDVSADIAVVAASPAPPTLDLSGTARGGSVLLVVEADAPEAASQLPAGARAAIHARALALHVATVPDGSLLDARARRTETILGGLLAIAGIAGDRARAAREAMLDDRPEGERARRVDAMASAFDSIRRVPAPAPGGDDGAAVAVPTAVRAMTRADDTIDCLSRFWSQTGVLYRAGDTDELTADPHLAVGAVPPLSSTFVDAGATCSTLPVFDPASCDGDPRAWTSCPDGSVAAVVISPRRLLDAGVALASAAGRPADVLASVAGKLARRMGQLVSSGAGPYDAGALLRGGLDAHLREAELEGERQAALRSALEHVVAAVGALPVARTPVFFDEPERAARGSGELLALVVNPDASPDPDLLLAEGRGHGIVGVARTPERVEAARGLWDLALRLPDARGETIERASKDPRVGPMGAMMLSRHCLLAMAGGGGAEPGSGAALALRGVMAAAERSLGPRIQAHLETVESLREELAERIHAVLADALPTADLGALAEGLEALGRGDVELGALSARVDAVVAGGHVDGAQLGRLVDAARELAELQWRVARGPDGLARARAGLAIAGETTAAWTGAFPSNPFTAPVVIDASGETGDLARGLLEGQLREVLSGLRLVRWARAVLEQPEAAADTARALAHLRFSDLTDEERALCPPIIVVGDGHALGVRGLAQLTWLLGSGLPVKIVVLSGIGGAARGASAGGDPGVALDHRADREPVDLGLLAALGRTAFVVQTSVAAGDHFAGGVARALAFDGPALVHVHAPSPRRHGFPACRMLEQARLAVAARAFPLFTYDPARPGVFGSRFELAADADGSGDDAGPTTVDWAACERRFAPHLRPLDPGDPSPTPVREYLRRSGSDRAGRTPFVTVRDEDGSERRLAVDAALVADADARVDVWRTLQELAGTVTPFTDRVRSEIEAGAAVAQQAALDELAATYEARIAQLRAAFEREATERVTAGLMTLAGYAEEGPP